MWFATDNGLSRFDGYTFKNYGLREGLKDPVVLYMQLDSKGCIWLLTLSGDLYFMPQHQPLGQKDSIHAFVGNEAIRQVPKEFFPDDFLIGENDEMYISFPRSGIMILKPDGSHQLVQAKNPFGTVFLYQTSVRWMRGYSKCPDELIDDYMATYGTKGQPPYEIHAKSSAEIEEFSLSAEAPSKGWVMDLPQNKWLINANDFLYEADGKAITAQRKIDYTTFRKSIVQRPDGSIFVGLQRTGGLRRYRNMDAWRAEVFEQLLPGKTISHVFDDSRGGLWVCTIENGVFYCPDTERKIFDRTAGLPIDYVSAIAFGSENDIFIGLRNGEVFRMSLPDNHLTPLPKVPGSQIVFDLLYDHKEHTLWVGNNKIGWLNGNKWEFPFQIKPAEKIPVFGAGKRLTLSKNSRWLWGANYTTFNKIDLAQKTLDILLGEYGLGGRALVALEAEDSRIWVGLPEGLFEYRDSQLLSPQPFFPEFKTRVDDLAELPDGTLVIATKGDGLLLWRDRFFLQLTTDDGLISNMLENLHVDEAGRIWVGSLQGLSRVTLAKRGDDLDPLIENFTTWHGLPSNEITQVRSRGTEVWVATTRGLMQWREPSTNTSVAPPFFESIALNGQLLTQATPVFGYHENNLAFHYLTLNYDQAGSIPYRYRLNDGAWYLTKDRIANFANLASGSYRFEVQSQNEDGIWSESLIYPFSILSPWWLRWWFFGLLALTALAVGLFIYKKQTSILKKELAFKEQVLDLEKKALQAQMNPHFIFNCLNSIQKLILDKDAAQAMRYLSRFGKLVRSTLNASLAGEVTLQEEVEMLENYLEMEKLRFKEVFNYQLTVHPSLDVFDIAFPPILLQPYVENAILHGMKAKEKGGKVAIDFHPLGKQVVVTITDNGPGIRQSAKQPLDHKSVGMTLTQRRLELLHNSPDKEGLVQVFEIKDEKGEVLGTKVQVRLR